MENSWKVAVVGASGVVGRALVQHLKQSEIQVVGLSRRPPVDLADAPFQPLDLTSPSECERIAKSTLSDVTHLVYTALFEKPGLISGWLEQDQMQTNLTMLRNLLRATKNRQQAATCHLIAGHKGLWRTCRTHEDTRP